VSVDIAMADNDALSLRSLTDPAPTNRTPQIEEKCRDVVASRTGGIQTRKTMRAAIRVFHSDRR